MNVTKIQIDCLAYGTSVVSGKTGIRTSLFDNGRAIDSTTLSWQSVMLPLYHSTASCNERETDRIRL